MNKRLTNSIALGVLWLAAGATVLILFALIAYVFINGIGAISPTGSPWVAAVIPWAGPSAWKWGCVTPIKFKV